MGALLEALKGINIPDKAQPVVQEADAALTSRYEDASYLKDLETKVKELEAELKQLNKERGIPGATQGLTYDKKSGTYIGKDGLRYCQKCAAKEMRTPMKDEPQGWFCAVCPYFYRDPDRPDEPLEPSGDADWRV